MIVRSLKRRIDAIGSDAARLKEDGTPTPWGEAIAHAEKLREQGVRVKIGDMGPMSIAIRDDNGLLHDPDDGTPAIQAFRPDGAPELISHWTDGYRHDPADGTPASCGFYPDGTPMWIDHYTNGKRHDPAAGTPARQEFYPDGKPGLISHYRRGFLDDPADGAPAYKEFYRDGSPSVVVYYSDGRLLHTESVY